MTSPSRCLSVEETAGNTLPLNAAMPAKGVDRRPEREPRKGDGEAFFHALLEGHDRALPKLLKRNRRLLDCRSIRALMQRAHDGKATKLLPRERKAGAYDHIPESSPLVFALRFGHTAVVRALLTAGADPNGIDAKGDTPLLAACRMATDEESDSAPVRLLLERRASPDLAPSGVQAPLLLSCAKGVSEVHYIVHHIVQLRLLRGASERPGLT